MDIVFPPCVFSDVWRLVMGGIGVIAAPGRAAGAAAEVPGGNRMPPDRPGGAAVSIRPADPAVLVGMTPPLPAAAKVAAAGVVAVSRTGAAPALDWPVSPLLAILINGLSRLVSGFCPPPPPLPPASPPKACESAPGNCVAIWVNEFMVWSSNPFRVNAWSTSLSVSLMAPRACWPAVSAVSGCLTGARSGAGPGAGGGPAAVRDGVGDGKRYRRRSAGYRHGLSADQGDIVSGVVDPAGPGGEDFAAGGRSSSRAGGQTGWVDRADGGWQFRQARGGR